MLNQRDRSQQMKNIGDRSCASRNTLQRTLSDAIPALHLHHLVVLACTFRRLTVLAIPLDPRCDLIVIELDHCGGIGGTGPATLVLSHSQDDTLAN